MIDYTIAATAAMVAEEIGQLDGSEVELAVICSEAVAEAIERLASDGIQADADELVKLIRILL